MSAAGYQVEHWHEDDVDLLGEGTADDDPRAILAAHIARLQASGASGVVIILGRASGAMIAWQALWPPAMGVCITPEELP